MIFIRKIGYTKKGAASSPRTPSSTSSHSVLPVDFAPGAVAVRSAISCVLSEQSSRARQKHDGHDHEDNDVGCLGIKDLGQPFGETQNITGHDGAQDRAHAAHD